MVDVLSSHDFSNGEYRSGKRTLIIFHATWCPFCRRFLSELERLLPPGGIPAALVDISDTGSPLWDTLSIDVVPTAIVFDEHRVVDRLNGISGLGLPSTEFRAFAERAAL